MTRDDVLRMAREAGIPDDNIPSLCHGRLETGVELLERFAALVAADARAARIVAQTENEALKARLAASGVAERRAVREARLAEREACAHVCDLLDAEVDKYPAACAAAIRARCAT